jgi:hypothetical protein
MNAEYFKRVTSRAREASCPQCLNTRFLAVLRCDFTPGDACLLVGECQHCGKRFDIENAPTLAEHQAQALSSLARERCACGEEPELRFVCDLGTEDCYFEAVCQNCRKHWRLLPPRPDQVNASLL